ncbi:MAG: fimbrillin family protein [Alistipes sp.]|nr:fimbrillin family protein [Alistipes sp.]
MKRIISLAVVALAAVACNKEAGEVVKPVAGSNEIRVEASMPGATRATMTQFEAGDVMGLYAVEYDGDSVAPLQLGGNFINNEAMTFDGAKWNPAHTLYWGENACDFYGIYPYQQLAGVKDVIFEVALDQTQPSTDEALGGYEASDLLWAKAERKSREDGDVFLSFKHMMSRVVVNVERGPNFEGELPENISVKLYNTATTAEVDWTIGSVKKYMFSDTKTIAMRQLDATTFDAIVVPQFIERITPLVELTMEGIAYLLEDSISFRPGYQHTITVTLNTSPDQEKIEIGFEGVVEEEWNSEDEGEL